MCTVPHCATELLVITFLFLLTCTCTVCAKKWHPLCPAYGQNWRYFHWTGSKSKQLVLLWTCSWWSIFAWYQSQVSSVQMDSPAGWCTTAYCEKNAWVVQQQGGHIEHIELCESVVANVETIQTVKYMVFCSLWHYIVVVDKGVTFWHTRYVGSGHDHGQCTPVVHDGRPRATPGPRPVIMWPMTCKRKTNDEN